jgi:hypothetical protein
LAAISAAGLNPFPPFSYSGGEEKSSFLLSISFREVDRIYDGGEIFFFFFEALITTCQISGMAGKRFTLFTILKHSLVITKRKMQKKKKKRKKKKRTESLC